MARAPKIKSKKTPIELDGTKIFYAALVSVAILSFLGFNYYHMNKMLSTNSASITEFEKPMEEVIREPAVAGLFYSADRNRLDKDIAHYLGNADEVKNPRPRILIVPHAGYQYSGTVAAKAYALLRPYAKDIKNVVIVGPSHYEHIYGLALPDYDSFKTPLGIIPINKQISQELIKDNDFISYSAKAHSKEHSIEVQLPFLQKVLDNFSIIPIAYGEVEPEKIASALEPLLKRKDTIIIFSADLSHYYNYEHAQSMDEHTAEMIENNDPDLGYDSSCGATGINAALIISKDTNLYPETIDLKNSGDTAGDKSRVVGYGAWSFTDNKEQKLVGIDYELNNLQDFADLYQNELREIVQIALEEAVGRNKIYKPSRASYSEHMFDKGASFVTLTQNGELRGCVGTVVPKEAIALNVAKSAYSAALEDARFNKLTSEELSRLDFSISLLTGLERIRFLDEDDLISKIDANVDGLVMVDGNRTGLFLPSVWKQLPDKKDFLQGLKIKTGLSPNYWSNKIIIYRFKTVEIKKNAN